MCYDSYMGTDHPNKRSDKDNAMRDAILPVLLTGLLMGAAITFAVVTHNNKREKESDSIHDILEKIDPQVIPIETSPKLLISDPTFYRNRLVRVRLSGCEWVNGEYIYRTRADAPPSVIIRPRVHPKSGAVPESVVGLCVGRMEAGEVLVVDAR